MSELKVVAVCGWPLSGKGTVARIIQQAMRVHWIDIDNLRVDAFGLPERDPVTTEQMKLDRGQMQGAYALLHTAVKHSLEMKKSLIVSATFSRPDYWNELATLTSANGANLEIIWCKPENDDDGEIRHRLQGRNFGLNSFSSVNSLRRYYEVKARFIPPPLPHLQLDTSPPHSVEESVTTALEYIRR